jgi:uncharacterized protein YjaZ
MPDAIAPRYDLINKQLCDLINKQLPLARNALVVAQQQIAALSLQPGAPRLALQTGLCLGSLAFPRFPRAVSTAQAAAAPSHTAHRISATLSVCRSDPSSYQQMGVFGGSLAQVRTVPNSFPC